MLPEVVDLNMPAEGVFHNLVIVAIRKRYPGHARKVMSALWGMGLMMLAKTIVVVSEHVNVHDLREVAWRATGNIDPRRDLVLVEGPAGDLDHAPPPPPPSPGSPTRPSPSPASRPPRGPWRCTRRGGRRPCART